MKEYIIKKRDYSPNAWGEIESADINIYKWLNNGYEPRTFAKLFYDDENIYIRFESFENKVRAVHKNLNDAVCTDSCVEFFLRPKNDERYFNFEVNAIGTPLIGIGKDRHERKNLNIDISIFDIKASVIDPKSYKGEKWTVEYKIPFSFLNEHYKNFNIKDGIFANLYKCGDDFDPPHFGMWNEVVVPEPDFHRPECFGIMYFEIPR